MLDVISLLNFQDFSSLLFLVLIIFPGVLWLYFKGYTKNLKEIEILIFGIGISLLILFVIISVFIFIDLILNFKLEIILPYLILFIIFTLSIIFLLNPQKCGKEINNLKLDWEENDKLTIILLIIFSFISFLMISLPLYTIYLKYTIVFLCILFPLILYFFKNLKIKMLNLILLVLIFSFCLVPLLNFSYLQLNPLFINILNINPVSSELHSDLSIYHIDDSENFYFKLNTVPYVNITNVTFQDRWFLNEELLGSNLNNIEPNKGYSFNNPFNQLGKWKLQVIAKYCINTNCNSNYIVENIYDFEVVK